MMNGGCIATGGGYMSVRFSLAIGRFFLDDCMVV